MLKNLDLIISREYLQRVRRKSFIISTLVVPVVFIALILAPVLISEWSTPTRTRVAVIDDSHQLLQLLHSDQLVDLVPALQPFDSLSVADGHDAILIIGKDILANPGNVKLYTHGATGSGLENDLAAQLKAAIEYRRMESYDIPNLPQIIQQVQADVQMTTYRLDKEGDESSSLLSTGLGTLMSLVLYMAITLYGQMVMTSIIEEKTNRVLEIVVSSVKPFTLMAGKIIGVGLVALTQLLIWLGLIAAFCFGVLPHLGSGNDASITAMISMLSDTGFMLGMFGYMILFLIGGYLLYASIFAAIGSAVDNIQDASQLQMIALLPVVIGFIITMTVGTDPNAGVTLWASIIPFTSPMVMTARIPFDIPGWQIWLSLGLLYAAFVGMVWVAAKVYRVGIFMYGKKPTLRDMLQWIRQS